MAAGARRWALEDVAIAQLKSGDREGAENTIQRLSQHVLSLRGATKDKIYASLEDKRLHSLGLNPFRDLGDPKELAAAVERAARNAESLQDNWMKGLMLRDIAIAQSRLGEYDAAVATLKKMVEARASVHREDPYEVPHYNIIDVLKVAKAFIAAGKREEAEKVIQQAVEMVRAIKDENGDAEAARAVIWQEIAITRALMGDVQGALKAQSEISVTNYVYGTLVFIARAQIKAGDIEGARRMADKIAQTDNPTANAVLAEIVEAQATRGDIKSAILLADSLDKKRAFEKAPALRAIAAARVKAGESQQPYDWALAQPTPIEKSYALLGVAEGLLESGASKRDGK